MRKLSRVANTGNITVGQAQYFGRRTEKSIKKQGKKGRRRQETTERLEAVRDREVARLEAAQARGKELGL